MHIGDELERHLPGIFKKIRQELPNLDVGKPNSDFYWDQSELCKAFFLLLVKDFPGTTLREYTFRLLKPAYIDEDLFHPSYAFCLDGRLFNERGATCRDDVVQGAIDFYMEGGYSDELNYTDSFATDKHHDLRDDECLEVSCREVPISNVIVKEKLLSICARHLPPFLLGLHTREVLSGRNNRRRI